ncbi:MAG: HAD family hydrolase [Candidatus Dormibacter sp.]|uniref:HAD family hydrolase n=1 Tax=Candidatus Dormibacter sp. TaxID=2973982 RepID=UPI000DAFCCA7|nr:MAG: HAD family hydrolase [Candidatus Dormibacteraeota bacterium]
MDAGSNQGQRRCGVIFDVDGTLVDSTYLHTLAWARTFREAGREVETYRIHRAVGMGSDQLIPALIGREQPELSEKHTEHYRGLGDEARAFPRVSELLRSLHSQGLQVILATSAKPEELKRLLAKIDADDTIDRVVSSEEVSTSKPAPDIFETALEQSGLNAGQALVVGDSVWDLKAASRCGLPAVAVVCGGTSRAELEEAGAVRVYEDPAELLADLRGWTQLIQAPN